MFYRYVWIYTDFYAWNEYTIFLFLWFLIVHKTKKSFWKKKDTKNNFFNENILYKTPENYAHFCDWNAFTLIRFNDFCLAKYSRIFGFHRTFHFLISHHTPHWPTSPHVMQYFRFSLHYNYIFNQIIILTRICCQFAKSSLKFVL